METITRRKIAGVRRTQKTADYYLDVLPLLKEWTEQGVPQEEQAGLLNAMGRVNFDGKPYTQVMVSRVLRRGIETGAIDPPNV
jgi:hypothetical protein